MREVNYNWRITKDIYDRKFKEMREKQTEISQEILDNKYNEEDYLVTKNTVLKLAKRAKEIFDSSETEEKRQLLNYLFQNLKLNQDNIKWELNIPFNVVSKYTHCTQWCRIVGEFRTLNWKEIDLRLKIFLENFNKDNIYLNDILNIKQLLIKMFL